MRIIKNVFRTGLIALAAVVAPFLIDGEMGAFIEATQHFERDGIAMAGVGALIDVPSAKERREDMSAVPDIHTHSGAHRGHAALTLCPRQSVSNAPRINDAGEVTRFSQTATVNGVALATVPTDGACLSSNFGTRAGRLHKGIDYQGLKANGAVYAGAAGVIREAGYRGDYGNYVLIDHGNGVFTRYAHLADLAPGVKSGNKIADGAPLGRMGNTASYKIPVHLHYEVLVGDHETAAKSFGLKPVSLFDYI